MILSACPKIKEVPCFDCEYPHENYWIQKVFVGNGRCFLQVSVKQKSCCMFQRFTETYNNFS